MEYCSSQLNNMGMSFITYGTRRPISLFWHNIQWNYPLQCKPWRLRQLKTPYERYWCLPEPPVLPVSPVPPVLPVPPASNCQTNVKGECVETCLGVSHFLVDKAADCACTTGLDSGCRQVCECPMASSCGSPTHTHIYIYVYSAWLSKGG